MLLLLLLFLIQHFLLHTVADNPGADPIIVDKALMNAARLAVKFLGESDARRYIVEIGKRLTQAGLPQSAARVYMSFNYRREALEALLEGHQWEDARDLAADLGDADLINMVDQRYKEGLKSHGDVEELANLDAGSAMDMYAERGEFEQCLQLAEKENDPKVLHKFVALYAKHLLDNQQPGDAVALYVKYSAPAYPQNYALYK